MTEALHNESPDTPVVAAVPSILREAREAAGLPVATLAAMLKVPADRLQALEDGRYADLPNLTFARALASSVCRALKIDPAAVLASLPQAGEVKLGSDRPLEPAAMRERRPVVAVDSILSRRGPLLGAAAVLVAAAALWWWLPDAEQPDASQAVTAPVAEPVEAVPAAGVPESGTVSTEVVSAAADQPASTASPSLPTAAVAAPTAASLPAPVPSQPVPPPVPAAAAPVAPVVAAATATAQDVSQPVLRLRASQPVWVQVNNAAGKQLLQRTLKAGESADVQGVGPYAVVLGRAGAVEVSVRGQSMDLSAYGSNQVARFEVK